MRYKAIVAAAALATAAGCVYVPPVTQGNVLRRGDVAQLKVGMTTEQVRYLFGSPSLANPFYPDTWYYVYYAKPHARQKAKVYRLVVHFQGGKVSSFETSGPVSDAPS